MVTVGIFDHDFNLYPQPTWGSWVNLVETACSNAGMKVLKANSCDGSQAPEQLNDCYIVFAHIVDTYWNELCKKAIESKKESILIRVSSVGISVGGFSLGGALKKINIIKSVGSVSQSEWTDLINGLNKYIVDKNEEALEVLVRKFTIIDSELVNATDVLYAFAILSRGFLVAKTSKDLKNNMPPPSEVEEILNKIGWDTTSNPKLPSAIELDTLWWKSIREQLKRVIHDSIIKKQLDNNSFNNIVQLSEEIEMNRPLNTLSIAKAYRELEILLEQVDS